MLAELFSIAAAFRDKYAMKNLTDKSIFFLVRDAGLARNQYEFSRLCGRNPTWFSCIAARELEMSITALGLLLANISMRAGTTSDATRKAMLNDLHAQLAMELSARCRERATASARS